MAKHLTKVMESLQPGRAKIEGLRVIAKSPIGVRCNLNLFLERIPNRVETYIVHETGCQSTERIKDPTAWLRERATRRGYVVIA